MGGRPWSKNEEDLLKRVQKDEIEKKGRTWPEALLVFMELASRPENGIEKVDGRLRNYTYMTLQQKWRKMSSEESRGKARDLNNAIARSWDKNAVGEDSLQNVGEGKKSAKEAGLAKDRKRKRSIKEDALLSVDEGKKVLKEAGLAKNKKRKKSTEDDVPPSIDEGKKSAKEAGSAKTRTGKTSKNKVSNVDANKEAGKITQAFQVGVDSEIEKKYVEEERAEKRAKEMRQTREMKPRRQREES